MSQLTILAERCIHQQVVSADCQACVNACPRGAWHMRTDGLGFDDEACDDCGLCVAACPTEALELPAPAPKLHIDDHGARVLLLACERAGVDGVEGVTPCLYALSPGWLLQRCDALRAERIEMVPGQCSTCARGASGMAWRTHWLAVSERLQRSGRTPPALKPIAASAWPARPSPTPEKTDLGRRRWFQRAVHTAPDPAPASLASHAPPLSSARRWMVERLSAPAGSRSAMPLWSVTLDSARCTLCQACATICPTAALRFESASPNPGRDAFNLDMRHCTGCGLCTAVCRDAALSAPQPAVGLLDEETIPLTRQRCRACQVEFLQFSAAESSTKSPGLCAICQRGRAVQCNRLIENSRPT